MILNIMGLLGVPKSQTTYMRTKIGDGNVNGNVHGNLPKMHNVRVGTWGHGRGGSIGGVDMWSMATIGVLVWEPGHMAVP